MLHWLARRRRQLVSPLAVDHLADRADVNGQALVQIARDMRAAAQGEQREARCAELLRWARNCEQAALEHLECINAITLDRLESMPDVPVYLGDFNPGKCQECGSAGATAPRNAQGDRRLNPPLSPPPVRPANQRRRPAPNLPRVDTGD